MGKSSTIFQVPFRWLFNTNASPNLKKALLKSHLLNHILLKAFDGVSVEYITVPGWKTSIVECKTFESLPQNAKDYITKIEDFLHIPGKHILLVVIIY